MLLYDNSCVIIASRLTISLTVTNNFGLSVVISLKLKTDVICN